MASTGQFNHTIPLSTGMADATKYYEDQVSPFETCYPGMLLAQSADGVDPHPTVGTLAERLICVENPYSGGSIYTPYGAGQLCMMRLGIPGDVFLMKVAALTTAHIYLGTVLMSNGDGWLRQLDATGHAIGRSLDEEQDVVFPRWTRVRLT